MQPSITRTREYLAENVRAILAHEKLSARAWAEKHSLDPRAVQRVVKAKHATTLDVITKIATAAGLQPWHLLTPSMEPDNPPVFTMKKSERDLYNRLKRDFAELPQAPANSQG